MRKLDFAVRSLNSTHGEGVSKMDTPYSKKQR